MDPSSIPSSPPPDYSLVSPWALNPVQQHEHQEDRPPVLLRRYTSSLNLANADELDEFQSDETPWTVQQRTSSSPTSSLRNSHGVLLIDNSKSSRNTFITSLKIPGWKIVNSSSKDAGGAAAFGAGFVVFQVCLKLRDITSDEEGEDVEETDSRAAHDVTGAESRVAAATAGRELVIWKRYSEFDALKERLKALYPDKMKSLPPLPSKSNLSKYRPTFLESRRKKLEYWLTVLLLNNDLGGTSTLREWVLSS